jgi:hypothetical protein
MPQVRDWITRQEVATFLAAESVYTCVVIQRRRIVCEDRSGWVYMLRLERCEQHL